MDLETFFLIENLTTIALALAVLAVGFKNRAKLRSNTARLKIIEKWREFRMALLLFGGSLLVYFIAESIRGLEPILHGLDLELVHEIGEILHIFLLILALGISAIVALEISLTSTDTERE